MSIRERRRGCLLMLLLMMMERSFGWINPLIIHRHHHHPMPSTSGGREAAAACRSVWGRKAIQVPSSSITLLATTETEDEKVVPSSSSSLEEATAASALLKEEKHIIRNPPRRVYETWMWRGHKINYRVEGGSGPPILLIHGFGASVGHYRHQMAMFPSLGHRVFAIDLLGFGASDKPSSVEVFELELWRDLLLDFMKEMEAKGEEPRWTVMGKSIGGLVTLMARGEEPRWTVMGNSIGGLLTLMVAKDRPEAVSGAVLFNCAGGLTSFRDEELPFILRPLWVFFRAVFFGDTFGPGLFARFRTEENVRKILCQVYGNTTMVDDDLVDILLLPGQDEGAEEVFLKIMRGPAGPSPEACLPHIKCPLIAIWGEADPWTPLTTGMHPGSRFHLHNPNFKLYALPGAGSKFHLYNPNFKLYALPGAGHCPQDECPKQVFDIVKPFLEEVYKKGG